MLKLFAAASFLTLAIGSIASDRREGESEKIIALERAALDRWGKGDPQGYLELYAPEVTYFDPGHEARIDGLETMKQMFAPIAGKIKIDRYEMVNPKIQRHGDIAILSFNVVNHLKLPNGESAVVRWNSTEIYQLIGGAWKIIHSHWSYTKPELKQPRPE